MIELAWVISLIAAFLLGYRIKVVTEEIKTVKVALSEKVSKPKKEEQKSMILDPDVINYQKDFDERMKRLNNK
jgi:hypothetical protein